MSKREVPHPGSLLAALFYCLQGPFGKTDDYLHGKP